MANNTNTTSKAITDFTIDTDPCKDCQRIVRECGEIIGCACDFGIFCEYAPYEV